MFTASIERKQMRLLGHYYSTDGNSNAELRLHPNLDTTRTKSDLTAHKETNRSNTKLEVFS
jgi:hypothetical protein